MGCASSKEVPNNNGDGSKVQPFTVSKKGEKKVVQPTSNDKARARRLSHIMQ